jgi:hypothetical protein
MSPKLSTRFSMSGLDKERNRLSKAKNLVYCYLCSMTIIAKISH